MMDSGILCGTKRDNLGREMRFQISSWESPVRQYLLLPSWSTDKYCILSHFSDFIFVIKGPSMDTADPLIDSSDKLLLIIPSALFENCLNFCKRSRTSCSQIRIFIAIWKIEREIYFLILIIFLYLFFTIKFFGLQKFFLQFV